MDRIPGVKVPIEVMEEAGLFAQKCRRPQSLHMTGDFDAAFPPGPFSPRSRTSVPTGTEANENAALLNR